MAPLFTLLRELDPSKRKSTVKVRAVRVYTILARGSGTINSIEVIFHDREGTRMHCSIERNFVKKYEDFFKEGHIYAIRHFFVEYNDLKFRTTQHPYKMQLYESTHAFEVFDDKFPVMMFNFKTFHALSPGNINETELFDIIGKVVGIRSPQSRENNGYLSKFMDIVLEDLQTEKLNCTLWGKEVDELISYINNGGTQPVVMLLVFCRAKMFKDKVNICNAFHVSKMVLNGDIEEVHDFRSRLMLRDEAAGSISQISTSETMVHGVEADLEKYDFKRTRELRQSESGVYWVCGTIMSIESYGNWFYYACSICRKKVEKSKEKYYCERCNKADVTGIERYKVQVRIADELGHVSVMLWDQYCRVLIGMSAATLRKLSQREGNEHSPKKLKELLDKDVLLLLTVRVNQVGAYSVSSMISDPKVIAKYMTPSATESQAEQDSDLLSKLVKSENDDDPKALSKSDEVSTPVKKNLQDVSDSMEHVRDAIGKRNLIGDFSVTGPLKKTKVMINEEAQSARDEDDGTKEDDNDI